MVCWRRFAAIAAEARALVASTALTKKRADGLWSALALRSDAERPGSVATGLRSDPRLGVLPLQDVAEAPEKSERKRA